MDCISLVRTDIRPQSFSLCTLALPLREESVWHFGEREARSDISITRQIRPRGAMSIARVKRGDIAVVLKQSTDPVGNVSELFIKSRSEAITTSYEVNRSIR